MTNAVVPVANMTAATTVKECTYTTTGMRTHKDDMTDILSNDIYASNQSLLIWIWIFYHLISSSPLPDTYCLFMLSR